MSEKQPKLSVAYAIFSLCIVLFFGGVMVGQGFESRGPSLFFFVAGAIWLTCIGVYNIGKWVGRNG